ncbi:MAG: hypothetical protein WAN79_00460, partial [Opitutaceae bacterium]
MIAALALAVFSSTAGASPLSQGTLLGANEKAQGYREGVVIAKPKASIQASIDSMERSEGLRLRAQFPRFGNIRVIKLAAGDTVAAAVKRLMATGRYDYVEPDLIRRGLAVPNDPDFSSQWGLSNSGAS